MTRRRWIYTSDGKVVEVTTRRDPNAYVGDSALWGDRAYDGMKAPDGTDIGSRSRHREYMRSRGITTMDDFKETWAKAEQQRDAYRTGQGGGAVTKDDIGRVIHELESKRG